MEERAITVDDALELIGRQENNFWDVKSARSGGKTVQKIAVALANADGGEFAVGIEDDKTGVGLDRWQGLASIEAGNPIVQALSVECEPPIPYQIAWLSIDGQQDKGYVCLVTVTKSASVHAAADGTAYIRKSALSERLNEQQRLDLSLSKGASSYENQDIADYSASDLAAEAELVYFLEHVSPKADPENFLAKERLVSKGSGLARVAGAILFADNPSAVLPKRCAVKIARYETRVDQPDRKHLAATPSTIEGPARLVIEQTIAAVQALIESVSFMGPDGSMQQLRYPPEVLKEVIVNAVIHRDYNISDDTRITVFDNRVEVRSPGLLPGHMTLENLLTDRFSRNSSINRLINKYPNPPNQDFGEGLKTVMRSMAEARLKAPQFSLEGTYFTVVIEHTPLARPQEIVLQYLESHDSISNSIGRQLTGINSENSMKDVFYTLRDSKVIERVPGKGGRSAAWRLVPPPAPRGQRQQPRRLTRAARRKKRK